MHDNETTKVVVSAILLTKKGILVLKRNRHFRELEYGKDLCDLPGGEMQFGEDMYVALNRELREETGCNVLVNSGEIDVITEVLSTARVKSFRINILVKWRGEFDVIKLSEEHSDFRFINNQAEIQAFSFLPGVGNYLYQHLEKRMLHNDHE